MTLFLSILISLGTLLYFVVHRRLLFGLQKLEIAASNPTSPLQKVSVLISVRNEEAILTESLTHLVQQDYPMEALEIILINDRSKDQTPVIMEEFRSKYPHLFKITTIETDNSLGLSPKKYALSQGIKSCTGQIILSTDADCLVPPTWVSAMASKFTENTSMVLGLTTYFQDKTLSPWLMGMQSLEFFSHSLVSASLIGNQFPINANANNLAYTRVAYDKVEGFSTNSHIISGDDDFLLQKIAKSKIGVIKFSADPLSYVTTRPSTSLTQIWEQRKRWASKCSFYGAKQVTFLSTIYAYYLLIFLMILAGIVCPIYLKIGLVVWCLKTFMDYQVMKKGAQIFKQHNLLSWFLPTAVVHIPLIIFAVAFGSFGQFTWKGQTVKKTGKTS